MGSEKDDVSAALRSCLLTFKNGTALAQLNKDYKALEGRYIPYRQLGFQSLELFVQNVPGIRTTRRGGDLWLETVPTKETAHISRLVAGQNQAKSRRRRTQLRPVSRNYQGMSRNSVRAVSSSYKAPTRAYGNAYNNTRSNISPAPQARFPSAKPLMQMVITPPTASNSTGNHRYMGNANGQTSSPSKRLIERAIQPRHDLDYAIKPKTLTFAPVPATIAPVPATIAPVPVTFAPVPVTFAPLPANISKKTLFPEISQTSKFHETSEIRKNVENTYPVFSGLLSDDRTLGMIETPISEIKSTFLQSPIEKSTTKIPWQPPPSRSKISERLTVQQPLSSFNSSTNSNIQISFANPMANNGFSPPTPNAASQDPRRELERIARERGNKDPLYKIIPVQGKNNKEARFYAKVEIGSDKFSSYPQEAETPMEAEILAARQALEQKRKEHYTNKSLAQTIDKDVMKKRLLEIVDEHNGVFIHKLPFIYQEKFKENLPNDWTNETEQWCEVIIEKGVNNSTILCRAVPSTPEKANERTPVSGKVILRPICHTEPGHLKLPDEHSWGAYVTLVTSTVEIWVRLIGENYSEKLESMTIEMAQYYSTMNTCSDDIHPGGYYAMMEDETWHRVRVLACDLTCDEAEIFFIDLGDEDTINISRLFPLDRKFCSLPSQVMRVSLVGLEDFGECQSILPQLEKYLLEGVFYIEDWNRDTDEYGPLADVIFYDTSGPEDIDVNDLIKKNILKSMRPDLDIAGHLTVVYVTHVETNGDVFIQVKNDGLRTLEKMLKKLVETGLTADERKRCVLERVENTSIYFVRCSETGEWYRAKFMKVAPIGKDGTRRLIMFSIDYGRTIIVDLSNVIQLEKLSDILANYPSQAIKVRLDKLETTTFGVDIIDRIKEIAPPTELLLLKVVKEGTNNAPPIVELFTRMHNILGSINNTLVLLSESKCVDGDGNNNVKAPRKRLERVSSRATVDHEETAKALPAPKIGEIGEYFDVHVTMAANPANFTIQPYDTKENLRAMMTKLQDDCKNSSELNPTPESIREGRLYAARHTDGDWYRGCVLNVIKQHNMVSVYYVDYGDVAVMEIKNLLPLSRQFLELPYQAIKARLFGLKPKSVDWSPEDCVRFQNLIVGKNLVSIVNEVDPDRHLPRDTVLGLSLIDVSTSEDIYIAEVLVNEGRAVWTD